MSDEEKIKELQKQIDDLSVQMRGYQQRLFALQQELNSLHEKAPSNPVNGTTSRSPQHFRLENFIGLRIIHLVGIVVLFIGLSIGVKYAIDRQLISEAARIILAYGAGIILYLLSWRLKKKYQLFSAILFSGAMASLYFTTYAAFVYYGFYSFAVTFLLMVGLTAYTAFEAIRYNRQEIAVLGMVGAYGIPFLISQNSERPDLLFSYIIVINVGIVYLSFQKRWKVMGQFALFISWTLFILWGFFRYQAKDFWTGFILLVTFYFLFTVNALANRIVRGESLTARDLQQVTTNNIALYLSALFVFGYGTIGKHLAAITGWVSIVMLLLVMLVYFFFPSEIPMQQYLAVQSMILLTMFIGFNWSGLVVTLLWVALAVILFVLGIYNHRSWPRLAAIVLAGVTLGKLVIFDS
ncbi:MAG TPA: DUF2339 domain-containing protein, partial [Chitinophagaceae bacterium]|nr:DUF2339 domain-containing protein [Chitinophagaceae bacterium]